MSSSCLYCISKAYEIVSCTSSCLTNSNITPSYPGSVFFGTATLSIIFFLAAFYFKNDLKKFIGFRLASIAFLSTSIFTLGLIFNGLYILKNLPFIIPLVGIGSYFISYLFSFYFIRISYNAVVFENKTFQRFLTKFSRKLNVKTPRIFMFISKEPKAFVVDGLKKAIFISDSLIEKLNNNSMKAVLLHELYHLKRGTGNLKNLINSIATLDFRIIPVPINELEKYEEEEVDKMLLAKHQIDMDAIKDKLWN